MSRSAVRDALRQAPARKYAKNTQLWREGDAFSGLYLVRSGAVKTLRLTPGGEEQITGFYLPGEYIGLDELAADIHRSSAKATLGSEVHRLPALQLYDLMATGAERRHVYQLMSTCLRQNKARFHQLSRMSAGERLAHLIYDLAARYGFQGCVLRGPDEGNGPSREGRRWCRGARPGRCRAYSTITRASGRLTGRQSA